MYKLVNDKLTNVPYMVIRLSDDANIPFVEGNRDYQTYLKWLDGYELQDTGWVKTSDSNTPEPTDQVNE